MKYRFNLKYAYSFGATNCAYYEDLNYITFEANDNAEAFKYAVSKQNDIDNKRDSKELLATDVSLVDCIEKYDANADDWSYININDVNKAKESLYLQIRTLLDNLANSFEKEIKKKSFYNYSDDTRSYSDSIKEVLGIDRYIKALEDPEYLKKIGVTDTNVVEIVHEILQQAYKLCDYTFFDLIDRRDTSIIVGYNEDDKKWYRDMGTGSFLSEDGKESALYPVYVKFTDDNDHDNDEYLDIGLSSNSFVKKRTIDVNEIINKLNLSEDNKNMEKEEQSLSL